MYLLEIVDNFFPTDHLEFCKPSNQTSHKVIDTYYVNLCQYDFTLNSCDWDNQILSFQISMFCVTSYLLFESFSSAKNIFLLKVRETSGSPVGLRSAGKGTIVEFKRFLVLWNDMNSSIFVFRAFIVKHNNVKATFVRYT